MSSEEDAGLDIWVAYQSPKDFPGVFVARRQVAMSGRVLVTDDVLTAGTLRELAHLVPVGLVWLARSEDDDPTILGCWL